MLLLPPLPHVQVHGEPRPLERPAERGGLHEVQGEPDDDGHGPPHALRHFPQPPGTTEQHPAAQQARGGLPGGIQVRTTT